MDAEQEMDLVHHGAGRARVTPFKRVHVVDQNLPPEDPPDPESSLPDLSSVYVFTKTVDRSSNVGSFL